MTWEMFGHWVIAAIIKYVNIPAAYYVGSGHARSLTRAHTCTDTIAYAKVSGVDNIAWRTQLHLTPVYQISSSHA